MVTPAELRKACAAFGTGVTVVTTREADRDYGMTVNAFLSLSLDPPLIGICIGLRARMLTRIQATGRFAVSVLSDDMADLAWHFAGRGSGATVPAFDDVAGLPIVRGAQAHFVTRLHATIPVGDHLLFVGAVETASRTADNRPLMFHNAAFGALIAPDAKEGAAPLRAVG
ncbi:flavin reductase [Methylobacterium sp. BTF04]|nr:flavin reductase [Methylobacterium sp. BTF04]